jgi:hypothetical protein
MCLTLATALGYAATASQVVGGIAAVRSLTKGSGPDSGVELARTEAAAAQTANAKTAARRRALRSNSLVTPSADVMSSGLLSGGRPTLGG